MLMKQQLFAINLAMILFFPKNNFWFQVNMKKKFTKIGNSWAMLFTKTMLEMLDIDPETEQAEIEFDKKVLIMKKEEK